MLDYIESEMTIAEKIKALRIKRGYTQKTLGMKAGINEANIRKYEAGTISNPTYNTLEKLATALEVPVFFFVSTGQKKDAKEWDEKFRNFLESENALIDYSLMYQEIKEELKEIENETDLLTKFIEKACRYKIIIEKDYVEITGEDNKVYKVKIKDYATMLNRCYKDIRYNIQRLLDDYKKK